MGTMTVLDKNRKYEKVGILSRMGYSQAEISQIVKIAPSTVSIWLSEIREGYRKKMEATRDEIIAERIELLRDVRREAYEALQKSKEDAVRTINETRTTELGVMDRRMKQVEGRLAHSKYMEIILDTIKQERELRGLDAPKKLDLRQAVMTLDWNQLTTRIGEADPCALADASDTVEAEILDMQAKALPQGG